ncbi:hypothetical protein [Serratia plymuthica]|uniref:phage tail tube protein n=1 Tax=Serratia plymuthica TaxID=82996 RepID=UPI0009375101|nr:hypothetical protein [Serratia plymuthica]OJT38470.1 hypothetical protein BSR04_18550 [Serratia plymuthica]
MRENYYYGQGKVFLAPRDNKRSLRWVGDVSSLEISFSYEQKITKTSRSGQLFQNKRFITGLTGSIRSSWHNFSTENLATLLGAQVSNEPFSYTEQVELPEGIVKGDLLALPHTTVFSVKVGGLESGKDYVIDRQWGTLEFLVTPAHQPLIVSYEHLANRSLSLFSEEKPEFHLRYQGVNMAEDLKPILFEIFRISIDPLAVLELISSGNDTASMEMTALIMPDLSRMDASVFSYFGRMQLVTPQPSLTYDGLITHNGKHQYRGK